MLVWWLLTLSRTTPSHPTLTLGGGGLLLTRMFSLLYISWKFGGRANILWAGLSELELSKLFEPPISLKLPRLQTRCSQWITTWCTSVDPQKKKFHGLLVLELFTKQAWKFCIFWYFCMSSGWATFFEIMISLKPLMLHSHCWKRLLTRRTAVFSVRNKFRGPVV